MLQKAFNILKKFSYLIFLFLGIGLLFLAFRNQDLSEIRDTLWRADFKWLFIILIISIFNHISRVVRWIILIEPLGYKPKVGNAFLALMAGYLTSYAIPRLGEVTRVLAVSKTDQIPAKPLFGTVITERIIDIACLFFVLILAILVEFDTLSAFYFKEIHTELSAVMQEKANALQTIAIVLALVGLSGLLLIFVYWKQLSQQGWFVKITQFVQQIWLGISSVFRLKKNGWFFAHTLFIWITYFFMTYLWFFSFEETSHLSWQAGLSMMVIGSFGRSLPIQGGGMGAYHYLFQQGILLYGVSSVYGATLAIMIHGLQTLHYLFVGGFCILLLSRKLRK
ncbi:MAG: hypothetical protein ACI81T_001407 [Bacteroidia bacterium]|jgi:uncharacterized protein (TIRG00374 family)